MKLKIDEIQILKVLSSLYIAVEICSNAHIFHFQHIYSHNMVELEIVEIRWDRMVEIADVRWNVDI